jgi:hypothetical protein
MAPDSKLLKTQIPVHGVVEIRCNNDHTLLLKASGIDKGEIETVCRKCKQKRLIKFPVTIQAQA